MARFEYFVVFAEMRTGSNLLEASLNALDGVSCHGELFSHHFVGQPGKDRAFGVSLADRDAEPIGLLTAMRHADRDLPGFRFFHDHDPRIKDYALRDSKCAKIVLTRNPLEAFISRKIAAKTNQWRLSDGKDRKNARVAFDLAEFQTYLSERSEFQADLRAGMQEAGQTAFAVTYDDIQRVEVVNGLADFLGVDARLGALPRGIKKQNPGRMADKVTNFEAMRMALASFDWLDLGKAPNFEPERGPAVPGFVAAAKSPLIYLPVQGGPVAEVTNWLRSLDGAAPMTKFTQKSLRKWLRETPGHRAFTVLRHPLARAYAGFCRHILADSPETFGAIRNILARDYRVALPAKGEKPGDLRDAFEGFLRFLEGNLAGRTSVRVDPVWATQSAVIEGMGRFMHPDLIVREEEAADALAALAAGCGAEAPLLTLQMATDAPPLAEVYDAKLEALARRVYRRDYVMFGFGDWPRVRMAT